jgi:pimeloyl-ACP methyl ester carboxylesterase
VQGNTLYVFDIERRFDQMKNELVAIRTSDDMLLHGAFFEADPKQSAAILLHGAMQNFYTGIGSFLPAMLAERGYSCLTANVRGHDLATAPDDNCRKVQGSIYDVFTDCVLDLNALIEFVNDRGYRKIVLIGHSQAAFKIMYAYGQMKYPQVSGLALISPPPSAKEMTTFLTGNKEYERAKLEAQEALARGDEYHLIVCKSRGNLPFVYAARAFKSFVEAEDLVNARFLVQNINCPMLILRGTRDLPPMTRELVETMRANSGRPELCELVEIEGASHYYSGCENQLTEALTGWMSRL